MVEDILVTVLLAAPLLFVNVWMLRPGHRGPSLGHLGASSGLWIMGAFMLAALRPGPRIYIQGSGAVMYAVVGGSMTLYFAQASWRVSKALGSTAAWFLLWAGFFATIFLFPLAFALAFLALEAFAVNLLIRLQRQQRSEGSKPERDPEGLHPK